jgi:hypothetical protein
MGDNVRCGPWPGSGDNQTQTEAGQCGVKREALEARIALLEERLELADRKLDYLLDKSRDTEARTMLIEADLRGQAIGSDLVAATKRLSIVLTTLQFLGLILVVMAAVVAGLSYSGV